MLVEELISVRWCDCMCSSVPTACLYCHLILSHLFKGNKMKPKVTTTLKHHVSTKYEFIFLFPKLGFFAMSAFSFHSSPIFFRAMRSDARVTVSCPQSLCLDVAVCTLWMVFSLQILQPSGTTIALEHSEPQELYLSLDISDFSQNPPWVSLC